MEDQSCATLHLTHELKRPTLSASWESGNVLNTAIKASGVGSGDVVLLEV